MFFGSTSLHGNMPAAPTPGPPIPKLKRPRSQPAPSITLRRGAKCCSSPSPSRLLPVPGRAGWPHECKRGPQERTEALTPSSPMTLNLRSIVVRLLFCFKASASAWPGRAGRPHGCKRGSQEHGSLSTIGTDSIVAQANRCEAAVLLQRLCQCLAGLGRQAT